LIWDDFKKRRNKLSNVHYKARTLIPKVKDICSICGKMVDEKGITKLELSNKNHSYNIPINPDDWQWVHRRCHFKYDIKNNGSEKFGRSKNYIKIYESKISRRIIKKIKKLYIKNKIGTVSISKFLKGEDPPIIISSSTVRNILIDNDVKMRGIYDRKGK